ncbi:MAG TPA: trigger factor [Mariprofundaceae bacterium]|nr:trigger factor [Mariprofundaceae bacterium]
MIQTKVKKIGDNEHHVHVTVAQEEYDRVHAEQASKLAGSVKLPGFRQGKMPNDMLAKQFGPKLHEDTVSELLQKHYMTAIESSGLMPAAQPDLDIPTVQSGQGFEFTLKVVTWPEVKVKPLSKLKFDTTAVEVTDQDIQTVIDRLMDSQVKYEIEDGRVSEQGDQVTIDFVGFVDGEAFEGGKGEDSQLVLGAGQFIPGFEEQLIGKKAGDDVTVEVTFPDEYQAAHLAGKAATFETQVKSVAKSVKAADEDDLAKMLGFDDAKALREDARVRLGEQGESAAAQSTREAAFDALLAANEVTLPERLIEEDIKATTQRVVQNMQQQGMEVTKDMFEDEAFKAEVRERSEKGLKLSVLIQAIRADAELEVDDAEIDAELEKMATQYPAEQKDQFISWIKSQQEQLASVRERLLEGKCVEYIVSQAKTKEVKKTLSEWQEEQEQA